MTSTPSTDGAPRPARARRIKSLVLMSAIAVSALTLISWTQTWFDLRLTGGEASGTAGSIAVPGDVAAGGLAALALSGLALVGALAIAGPVVRLILAVLEILIGATITLSAIVALLDPVGVSTASITTATGFTGAEPTRALVASVGITPWPVIAAVLGVITVIIGVVMAVTSRTWPGTSAKYRATTFADADDAPGAPATTPRTPYDVFAGSDDGRSDDTRPDDTGQDDGPASPPPADARGSDHVADWDALSDGSDPTR